MAGCSCWWARIKSFSQEKQCNTEARSLRACQRWLRGEEFEMAKKGTWESMYRNCEWQLSKFPVLSSLAGRKSQAVSFSSSWRRKKTGRTKWNLRPYIFWKNGLWPDMRGLGEEEWNESWLQYTVTVKIWRPKGKGKKSPFLSQK